MKDGTSRPGEQLDADRPVGIEVEYFQTFGGKKRSAPPGMNWHHQISDKPR